MEYELLAILYATKNSRKLSASQMDAIKEFAIFLDTRGLTLHEPVTAIQGGFTCENCGCANSGSFDTCVECDAPRPS